MASKNSVLEVTQTTAYAKETFDLCVQVHPQALQQLMMMRMTARMWSLSAKKPAAAKPVTAEVLNDANTKWKQAADDPAGPGVNKQIKKLKPDDSVIMLN